MKKQVLFYSSVKSKRMFAIQSYYRNDIQILRELGYQVLLSNSIFDFFCFWKYDIAYLFFYRYSLLCALTAKLFLKKVYFTGGIDYLDEDFATRKQRNAQILLFKLCYLLSDTNIIVSNSDKENIKKVYNGRFPKKCKLNFHVVNTDNLIYKGSFSSKKRYFLTLAWMVKRDNVFRKGIDKSLRIFAKVVNSCPDFQFIIAGPEGEGSQYVQELINSLNLKEHVFLLPAISEKHKKQLLQESMFYFQLSSYEGFGIAAAEALAAGNILIHSGRGGLSDAAGGFGYIFDINDENSIADFLIEQCTQKTITNSTMHEATEYVQSHFSHENRKQFLQNTIA